MRVIDVTHVIENTMDPLYLQLRGLSSANSCLPISGFAGSI